MLYFRGAGPRKLCTRLDEAGDWVDVHGYRVYSLIPVTGARTNSETGKTRNNIS